MSVISCQCHVSLGGSGDGTTGRDDGTGTTGREQSWENYSNVRGNVILLCFVLNRFYCLTEDWLQLYCNRTACETRITCHYDTVPYADFFYKQDDTIIRLSLKSITPDLHFTKKNLEYPFLINKMKIEELKNK